MWKKSLLRTLGTPSRQKILLVLSQNLLCKILPISLSSALWGSSLCWPTPKSSLSLLVNDPSPLLLSWRCYNLPMLLQPTLDTHTPSLLISPLKPQFACVLTSSADTGAQMAMSPLLLGNSRNALKHHPLFSPSRGPGIQQRHLFFHELFCFRFPWTIFLFSMN